MISQRKDRSVDGRVRDRVIKKEERMEEGLREDRERRKVRIAQSEI